MTMRDGNVIDYVLDAHALVWMLEGNPRLGVAARLHLFWMLDPKQSQSHAECAPRQFAQRKPAFPNGALRFEHRTMLEKRVKLRGQIVKIGAQMMRLQLAPHQIDNLPKP